ncbi:MAG: hypothetical protein WCI57_05340 [Candidatus Berkelbacteria bacterium]
MKYSESNFSKLKKAIEASWDKETAYHEIKEDGNPSLGQCLPTSFVVHHFFPDISIIKGKILNGAETEEHYWNSIVEKNKLQHIDLTKEQFQLNPTIQEFEIFDYSSLDKNSSAVKRCELLLERVSNKLSGETE